MYLVEIYTGRRSLGGLDLDGLVGVGLAVTRESQPSGVMLG